MMGPKAKLIFWKEVRDQIRDRRTLFMILILPLVLYPALGLGLLQLTVSFGQQVRTIGIIGADELPADPPLLTEDRTSFHPDVLNPGRPASMVVIADDQLRREDITSGKVDAILDIPPGVGKRLDKGEQAKINILYSSSNDRSELAHVVVRELLSGWSRKLVDARMAEAGHPENFAIPISIQDGETDVSASSGRSGSAWSRMFPFLLVMMALTGAFYPAVDLCAGEKERGTMETLLISPASRGEIVLGKFLTIFLFSVATTIVNLVSMGLTFTQTTLMVPPMARESLAGIFAPPSFSVILWMFALMVPMSAFFSALCMALAIFARSTKEGQYYLMPLFLVVTPLVFLTMAPGVELDPFYSLVPVTNVALLLKTLMLHQYDTALVYLIPVLAPTGLYVYLALRYAADQFNREDVLFREAERFDLAQLGRQLFIDRVPTPTFAMAWAFFVIYMMLRWYLQGHLSISAWGIVASQVLTLLVPAIAMALLLTRRPLRSLHLQTPALIPTLVALALVITLHPVAVAFATALERAIPLRDAEGLAQMLMPLFNRPLHERILLTAVLPAVCEEIAFRGFVLSGLMQRYRPGLAILITGILFGVSHMIPQQMIATSILGVILGIITTRTGSIFPAIVFHAAHNGMLITFLSGAEGTSAIPSYPLPLVLVCALLSAVLAGYLAGLPNLIRRVPRAPLFSEEKPAVVHEAVSA